MATVPVSPPIYMTSVWQCTDPEQAGKLLAGEESGYVYQRDRHPNADLLQQTCAELHGAKHATVSAAGMSSLAVVMLALLQKGDLVAVSSRGACQTKSGHSRDQGATAQFEIRHFVLPFDNRPHGGSVDRNECTPT